ncbi:exported hypothetical protein [Azospirillaceae bacterium]
MTPTATKALPAPRATMGFLLAASIFAAGWTLSLNCAHAAPARGSTADIQWAQQILKNKGLYHQRPNGVMSDETHSALSAFQKSVGLPPSGELDQPTIDRLISAKPASSTVGNLAAPDARARARAQAEAATPPPQPRAAITHSVTTEGGGDMMTGAVVVRSGMAPPPPGALSGSHASTGSHASIGSNAGPNSQSPHLQPRVGPDGAPIPHAAPRAAVSASETLIPDAADTDAAPSIPNSNVPLNIIAPGWARSAIMGFIGAILTGIIGVWWWSGRRRGLTKRTTSSQSLEPSLGPTLGPSLSSKNVNRKNKDVTLAPKKANLTAFTPEDSASERRMPNLESSPSLSSGLTAARSAATSRRSTDSVESWPSLSGRLRPGDKK